MTSPSVSVVIPGATDPTALERSLSSVDALEYDGDLDVVVIDATKTKRTRQTTAPYEMVTSHWLFAHYPTPASDHERRALCRDLGSYFAEGTYVHFLDPGDELRAGAITRKVAALEETSGVGAIYTPAVRPDGSGGHVPEAVRANELAYTLIYGKSPAAPATLLVERSLLADLPPRRRLPHEHIAGFIELLLRTTIAYLDDPLTVVHPREGHTDDLHERRLRTYDHYTGLRCQLLSEDQQATADAKREAVAARVGSADTNNS